MGWRVRLIVLLTLLLGAATVPAAELRAWLDREAMQLGETITLNVEADSDGGAQPDFSPLTKDFDLLDTSSSPSMSLVNGQASARQLWAIGLQPKHVGRIEIPPLAVGNARTNALVLVVAPAMPGGMHASDDVFVEIVADPKMPYVQQQVRCTVKLYYAVSLVDGILEDPHAPGVLVQKLGQDRNFQAELDGRAYRVVERHYALSAEASGTLTIPPVNFRGRAVTGSDPASLFFTRGREFSARSNPLVFDVRPRPASANKGAWLPAQSLDYALHGLDSAMARVGEPLTLTLNLRAQGLGFEQLPELALPPIDGAEIYPDKSTTRTRDDGVWLVGERERKFAVVPTRAGTLKLPVLRLAWWDAQNDRAAVAEIPAQEISVEAAVGATPAPPPLSVEAPAMQPVSSAPGVEIAPAKPVAEISDWKRVALGSLALWFVSLVAVLGWRWRRMSKPVASAAIDLATSRVIRERGRRACVEGDVNSAARALLDLARAERIDVRNLGELGAALASDEQRKALTELERARFGDGDVMEACAAVSRLFVKGFVRSSAHLATEVPLLAPLYPDVNRRRHGA